MKIRTFLTAGVTGAAALLLSGCPAPVAPDSSPASAATITVDVAKTVKLGVGQTVAIRLGSNPSTGYSWEVDQKSLGDVLSMVGKPTYTPDPAPAGVVGSGGTDTFVLLAKKPGSQMVNFLDRAPGTHKIGRHVIVEIDVH